MNSKSMSAGRPKKKGFQKKSASSSENLQSIDSIVQDSSHSITPYVRNSPIGLLNGCNICFINCVLQILYYIPALSERLDFCFLNGMASPIVIALRELFREMSSSAFAVDTSKYFQSLKGDFNWTLGNQQDSNEFLINALQYLYTKKKNETGRMTGDLITNCPFNIKVMKGLKCIGCTQHSEKYTNNSTLALSVNNQTPTSIQQLISDAQHIEDIVLYTVDHESNACQGTQCFQTEDIISVADYLIIQLNVFDFDRVTQMPYKKSLKLK